MSDLRPAPGFRQRLGYYAFGLAIGFMLLGILWYMRWQAAQSQGGAPAPGQPAQTPSPGSPPK